MEADGATSTNHEQHHSPNNQTMHEHPFSQTGTASDGYFSPYRAPSHPVRSIIRCVIDCIFQYKDDSPADSLNNQAVNCGIPARPCIP